MIGLGLLSRFATGGTLGFFFSLGLFDALFVKLKAVASVIGFYFFFPGLTNLTFGGAIVLHQGNIARADVGAGATFYAVKQIVRFETVVFLCLGIPKQLLWQQRNRTGFGTHATA